VNNEQKIPFTQPIISVDRAAKTVAVFDGTDLIHPFHVYTDEREAVQERKQWIAQHTDLEPEIVYPRITRMTVRTVRSGYGQKSENRKQS
jgi:hypothetical protein